MGGEAPGPRQPRSETNPPMSPAFNAGQPGFAAAPLTAESKPMRRTVTFLLLLAGTALAVPTSAQATIHTQPCYSYARSDAVRYILQRESGGSPSADNKNSSAFGCGQLLYGMRARYGRRCGGPNTRSAAAQMCAMHAYIDARYGSDAAAIAFWRRHRWY